MEHAILTSDDKPQDGEDSPTRGLTPSSSEANVEMIDTDDSQHWRQRTSGNDRAERPSNEKLLSTAFISFMSFTMCQTVAAFIAGSEAMMGDSAAMFVDALTYLFNLVAERKKNRFEEQYEGVDQDPTRARRKRQRARRKMTLHLELVPPLISVTSLIIVTAFVLRKAIRVLILDTHRDPSKQGDPNINLMIIFSSINLCLDFINVVCFARAKHLMGYDTHVVQEREGSRIYESLHTIDTGLDDDGVPGTSRQEDDHGMQSEGSNGTHENGDNDDVALTCTTQEQSNGVTPHSLDEKHVHLCDEEEKKEGANLNMCSAYTHVFADTLRSFAVIIAAVTAKVVDGVTPEEADATAAVVVSVLILLSLIPLFHGLQQTTLELRAIRAEESSESMFSEQSNQTNELLIV